MTKDAFKATFHNIRPVHGRKQVQFIFEVPMEKANAALQILGGIPNPEVSVWAGIARLSEDTAEQPAQVPQKPADAPGPANARTPFLELPRSQQAALACGWPSFQEWLGIKIWHLPKVDAEEAAIRELRSTLGVVSRSLLDDVSCAAAAEKWDALYARFEEETGRIAERHG